MTQDDNEVLRPEFVPVYERELGILWRELVRLNNLLFIIRIIAKFPFHLFGGHNNHFWVLTTDSMRETCIMILCRTCLDRRKDVLGLRRLKDKLLDNIIDDDAKDRFAQCVDDVKFESTIERIGAKLKDIRDNHLAHLSRSRLVSTVVRDSQGERPTLMELEDITKVVNNLVQAISLGHGRGMTYWQYNRDIEFSDGSDHHSDIERLLDLVAKDSPLLNMPEQQQQYWQSYRESLSEDEMRAMSQYRQKFGLPEV